MIFYPNDSDSSPMASFASRTNVRDQGFSPSAAGGRRSEGGKLAAVKIARRSKPQKRFWAPQVLAMGSNPVTPTINRQTRMRLPVSLFHGSLFTFYPSCSELIASSCDRRIKIAAVQPCSSQPRPSPVAESNSSCKTPSFRRIPYSRRAAAVL